MITHWKLTGIFSCLCAFFLRNINKIMGIFFWKYRKKKTFFYPVSILDRPSKIKLGKRSLMCYQEDTRMDDIQRSGSPKPKIASSHQLRCMCCVLDINLTRKFVMDLSLQIFLIHFIWWSILVTNLVTDFEDLVAKVKNLVALVVPVLGTISCPVNILQ